jgi:hypothetical protein
MDFRSLIPMGPVWLQPLLRQLADWRDKTDRRLDELEARIERRRAHPMEGSMEISMTLAA